MIREVPVRLVDGKQARIERSQIERKGDRSLVGVSQRVLRITHQQTKNTQRFDCPERTSSSVGSNQDSRSKSNQIKCRRSQIEANRASTVSNWSQLELWRGIRSRANQIWGSPEDVEFFFILCLQAMIIVAWNGSGQPSSIFSSDVFKKVLSVFITAAILKLGQGRLHFISLLS
ncbi:glucan synthase-like 12 [Actinidia rufa]|uniref:Glucan synthase-like 12 n=1 Tax=Actinidia rufa TaxID=165716 RepID=A0A7J0FJT9_9ERIC|nr:glucan synthase-like 12 [Actinidia rufa]